MNEDKKLNKMSCYCKLVPDKVNKKGFVSLIYFYGCLKYKDVIEYGCYEYFIDSTKTLFHRMFRPLNQVSSNVKLKLSPYIHEKKSDGNNKDIIIKIEKDKKENKIKRNKCLIHTK